MDARNFDLVAEDLVDEVQSCVRLWRHKSTLTELISFNNQDSNKVFGITFRTIPTDSSGLPHILEHCVLCGSRAYPSKNPFAHLLKSSLQTYLNGITYPDKTCYLAASPNLKDFRNITRVYLDAVFFPLLKQETFLQEGWHVCRNEQGQPVIHGVVYNEMKGAQASPEHLSANHAIRGLFPQTPYGYDSGGIPESITKATYENLVQYHKTFYHPSNAKIFYWGDDPELERLAQVDDYLSRFTYSPAALPVVMPLAWMSPRNETIRYADSSSAKGLVTCSWALDDVLDPVAGLSLEILALALTGLPVSPLRRMLLESKAGEDVIGDGLDTDLPKMVYSIGLRGVSDYEAAEKAVLNTFYEISEQGLDPNLVLSALNIIEFALRESNTGSYPVGLFTLMRFLPAWINGGNPFEAVRYESHLSALKKRLQQNPDFFKDLVNKSFIRNQHRLTLKVIPDDTLEQLKNAEEQDRAEKLLESHGEVFVPSSACDEITESALSRQDLPAKHSVITSYSHEQCKSVRITPISTRGVVYAEAAFDLSHLTHWQMSLVPAICRIVLEVGTARRSFEQINLDINTLTGGMYAYPLISDHIFSPHPVARLVISGKCLADRISCMFEILSECINETLLHNEEHIRNIFTEEKGRMEQMLPIVGNTIAATRAGACLAARGKIDETISGVSYLAFLRGLEEGAADWCSMANEIQEVFKSVFCQSNLVFNVTCDPKNVEQSSDHALAFFSGLPFTPKTTNPGFNWQPDSSFPRHEGIVISSKVNHVACGSILDLGDVRRKGAMLVACNLLKNNYLWQEIRVKNGAYGAGCRLDLATGAFVVASYRDPHIQGTLDIFSKLPEYFSHQTISQAELDSAIIGTIGDFDPYLLPSMKGTESLSRYLTQSSDEYLQALRDDILSATTRDVAEFADLLAVGEKVIRVVGGSDLKAYAQANDWPIVAL